MLHTFKFEYKLADDNDKLLVETCKPWESSRNACLLCSAALVEGMKEDEISALMDGCREIAEIAKMVLGFVECSFAKVLNVYEVCKVIYSYGYSAGFNAGTMDVWQKVTLVEK